MFGNWCVQPKSCLPTRRDQPPYACAGLRIRAAAGQNRHFGLSPGKIRLLFRRNRTSESFRQGYLHFYHDSSHLRGYIFRKLWEMSAQAGRSTAELQSACRKHETRCWRKLFWRRLPAPITTCERALSVLRCLQSGCRNEATAGANQDAVHMSIGRRAEVDDVQGNILRRAAS
jgi:hypothetical protein